MPPLWGTALNGAPSLGPLGPVPQVEAGSPATRGVARPEGGESGCVGAQQVVGAGCSGTVGGSFAHTPPCKRAHMECSGPHALGIEFTRHIIEESIRVWYAHAKARATLLKARLGPNSTMVWVLQELHVHQQAEREGVQWELLG